MSEYTARVYTREEQFLEDHLGTIEEVVQALAGDWQPDFGCNDKRREASRQAMANGQLHALAFEDAFISNGKIGDGKTGMVAISINLRSSVRWVSLRVTWEGGRAIVEKRADKAQRLVGNIAVPI